MALRSYVCRIQDVVADELRSFRVQGLTWPVIATFVDGSIVVSQGVCPHEDVSLADAELVDATVFCGAHGYGFDLRSGRCNVRPELSLRRYPVTIIDDEVWADLL
jgi:toluene monooxygenase system ferredoxin subunit